MSSIVPGSVISFSGNAEKLARLEAQGWLKCDGRTVSKQTYPELFSMIGTTYGGNGNPDFALPNMRGLFLRGVDDGRQMDPDGGSRRVGGIQGHLLANHQHNWDHFFFNISDAGDDIAAHQPADSGHTENNTRQATNNDGGGNETRPKNMS